MEANCALKGFLLARADVMGNIVSCLRQSISVDRSDHTCAEDQDFHKELRLYFAFSYRTNPPARIRTTWMSLQPK
jgi:hypothetical protein